MKTSAIVGHLEATWNAIRNKHPDVPPVIFTIGSGTMGAKGTLRRGHWAPKRWEVGEVLANIPPVRITHHHEVFLAGERLRDGAEGVLSTLLHEAAHGLAYVRGIKDTSRQGRYHNKRFKALAEELGLLVEKDRTIGWSLTRVRPEVLDEYYLQGALDKLDQAMKGYRLDELEAGQIVRGTDDDEDGDTDTDTDDPPAPKLPSKIRISCKCKAPRKLWCAPSTWSAGDIVCRECHHPFLPDEEILELLSPAAPLTHEDVKVDRYRSNNRATVRCRTTGMPLGELHHRWRGCAGSDRAPGAYGALFVDEAGNECGEYHHTRKAALDVIAGAYTLRAGGDELPRKRAGASFQPLQPAELECDTFQWPCPTADRCLEQGVCRGSMRFGQ